MKTYQCTKCGCTHKEDWQHIRDNIYSDIFCPHCKETTTHLECGEDILEFYKYYDPVTDKRFYNYKTK